MRRIPELDALKGLAVLALAAAPALMWPIDGAAVELFLVLSGFLLTWRLGDRPDRLRDLYLRRAWRWAPAYLLAMLGLLLVPHPEPVLSRHGPLALVVQGVLVWPLVLRATRARLRPLVLLAALAGSITARASGWSPWLLFAHTDGLVLGTLLAWTFADRERVGACRRTIRCVLLPVVLALLGFLLREYRRGGMPFEGTYLRPASTVLALDLSCAALLGLVLAHEGFPILGWLRQPALCELGRLSYGTTLVWVLLQPLSRTLTERHPAPISLAPALLALGVSVGLAALIRRFVERPIARWRTELRAGSDGGGTRRDEAHARPSGNLGPRRAIFKESPLTAPPGSAPGNAPR